MQFALYKPTIFFLGLDSHIAQRYVLFKNIQNSNKSLPSRMSINAFHTCNQYVHYQWASLMGWHGSCLQCHCLPGRKDATIQPYRTQQSWFAKKGIKPKHLVITWKNKHEWKKKRKRSINLCWIISKHKFSVVPQSISHLPFGVLINEIMWVQVICNMNQTVFHGWSESRPEWTQNSLLVHFLLQMNSFSHFDTRRFVIFGNYRNKVSWASKWNPCMKSYIKQTCTLKNNTKHTINLWPPIRVGVVRTIS